MSAEKRNRDAWRTFRNVLCVRPDNLGDLLMTTPAIRALKEAVPGRRITLLTSRAGAAAARNIPEVDDIITFDPPWYRHRSTAGRDDVARVVATLSERNFEAAVIFTVFSQNPLATAMLCYQAGIERVAGHCRENPYALMSDWFPDEEPLVGVKHEVQRQLDLVTGLGAIPTDSRLSLSVPVCDEDRVMDRLSAAGVDLEKPWILMHPGASERRRRYPPEWFAEAARRIHSETGTQVVLTGDRREKELAAAVAKAGGAGTFSVAGMFDLDEFIFLVSRAPMLVSNNTGPVHIAAATNTPVVVLYAQTNPQHTPWRVPHRVLKFSVPESQSSRNVMVRYSRQQYFAANDRDATPADIVAAVTELMEIRSTAFPGRSSPVPRGTGALAVGQE